MAEPHRAAPDSRLAYTLVERVELGRGPTGPVRTADGHAFHGVYQTVVGDVAERMVVNNGVVYATWTYPSALRSSFASRMHSDLNAVLAVRMWLYRSREALRSTHPLDAQVERVCHRRQPLAIVDTHDASLASEWVRRAQQAVVAVAHRLEDDACDSGHPVHFVALGAHQRFGALFDLGALIDDYALLGLDGQVVDDVIQAIDELRDVAVIDLLDDPDLLSPASPAAEVRSGLALGRSPASTAARITPSGLEHWPQ